MTTSPSRPATAIVVRSLRPGPGTAVVWHDVALLIHAPVDHPAVRRAADLTTPAPAEVLDALVADAIGETPPFTLLAAEPDGTRVIDRHGARSLPWGEDQPDPRPSSDLLTWTETRWPSLERAWMAIDEVGVPMQWADDDSTFAWTDGLGARILSSTGCLSVEAAPVGEPPATLSAPNEGVRSAAGDAPESEEPAAPSVDHPETPVDDSGPDLDFGHLFDNTTYRRAEPDVTPPASDDDGTVDHSIPTRHAPGADHLGAEPDPIAIPTILPTAHKADPPPAHVPPPAVSAPSPEPGDDRGLISSVPGMTPPPEPPVASPPPATAQASTATPPPAAPTPPTPPPVAPAQAPTPDADQTPQPTTPEAGSDLDDATVSVAAIRAARAAVGGASTPSGPTVQAVLCPSGHPNPTYAEVCRTCDEPIRDHTVHTVARPALGRIRFDDGTVAHLDRHLIIGRNPSANSYPGLDPVDLLRLDDPDQVLSRTHLVLRLDGWQVQAIDRDSLNHTFVQVPGRPAFQLRPGEPFPLPLGSVVRLGDEIGFTYEAGS